jgi:hypothetical protein
VWLRVCFIVGVFVLDLCVGGECRVHDPQRRTSQDALTTHNTHRAHTHNQVKKKSHERPHVWQVYTIHVSTPESHHSVPSVSSPLVSRAHLQDEVEQSVPPVHAL